MLRWGFLGCGRIASDFANGVKCVPNASLSACAARSHDSADRFASTHGFKSAYGSYEQLCEDEDVDIIYVSTIHHCHKSAVLMALERGKHVLVEKPIALTLPDTQEMVEEARGRGLFLMEAMWTRFFPAVRRARELIEAGEIGDIKAVHSDFGFVLDPDARPYMMDPSQGGGGLMEIGCYPIHAATMAMGTEHELTVFFCF